MFYIYFSYNFSLFCCENRILVYINLPKAHPQRKFIYLSRLNSVSDISSYSLTGICIRGGEGKQQQQMKQTQSKRNMLTNILVKVSMSYSIFDMLT